MPSSPSSVDGSTVTMGPCEPERRRSATERERLRLRRVNAAFDALRQRTCCHVTYHHTVRRRPVPGRRLSKLDILRRAISYIGHLERLLHKGSSHPQPACIVSRQLGIIWEKCGFFVMFICFFCVFFICAIILRRDATQSAVLLRQVVCP